MVLYGEFAIHLNDHLKYYKFSTLDSLYNMLKMISGSARTLKLTTFRRM